MLDPHECLFRRKCQKVSDVSEPVESATPLAKHDIHERRRRVDSNLVSTILEHGSADLAWLTEELTAREDINLAAASDGTTPLHATLGTPVSGIDREWLAPTVELLIARGISVDAKNDCGQTPLHVAVQNDIPADCLRLLLDRTTDVNACDDKLQSSLQLMLTSPRAVDPACFRMLLQAGGNLNHLYCVESHASLLPPIYLLCERSTDFPALFAVVREEMPDILWLNKNGILRHAAKHGSEAAIEALLDEFGEDSEVKQSLDGLLLEAASSVHNAEGKVKRLISRGANVASGSSSEQILVHVAAKKGSIVLLEISLQHGQDPNQQDEDGNAAVHYATFAEGSNVVECIQLLVRYGADVNAINRQGRLPISIAVAAGHSEQVLALLKLGSNLPPPTIAREVSVATVAALADDKIIEASPNPLEATLELGSFYKKCGDIQSSCGNEYRDLALSMETKATKMLGHKSGTITSNILSRDTIFTAVSNSQKKFLAHPGVQKYLKEVWWSVQYSHTMTIISYVWLLLLHISRIALLPIVLLCWFLPVHRHYYGNYINKWLKQSPPCIRHTASTLLYIIFIILLVYDSSTNDCLKKRSHLQATDYVILVYVISFCLHQATLGVRQGLHRYLSDWMNIVCALSTTLLLSYCIIRFLVLISKEKQSFQITELACLRVASLIRALAVFVACLHLLNYLKVYSGIGHILMSLYHVTLDVILFLLIFITIATAFALSISSVYAAGWYTDMYESAIARCLNGNMSPEFNVSALTTKPVGLGVIPKAFKEGTSLTTESDCIRELLDSSQSEWSIPVAVNGFGMTMGNMIWALFGLVKVSDFEAATTLETTIGKAMFTLWLLVAIFLLLIMCSTIIVKFIQDKQKSSDDELQFARAVAIHDLEVSPSVPPPFNILYSVAVIIAYICSHWFTKSNGGNEDIVDDDCSAKSASAMINNYKRKEAEELNNKLAKKADIESVNQHLLSLESTLLSWSDCQKSGSSDSGTLSFDPDTSSVNPSRCHYNTGNTEAPSVPVPLSQQLLEMMKSMHQVVGTLDRKVNRIEKHLQEVNRIKRQL